MKIFKHLKQFLTNHKETFINLLVLFVQEIAKLSDKDIENKE